jgi:prepilin-type N-terminal cleavage/methylation domain-containing protein
MRPVRALPKRAFTLIELMIVVLVLMVLLEIAVPSFFSARTQSYIRSCTGNLSHIDGAKLQYAMDFGLPSGTNVHDAVDLVPRYLETWPTGPTNGTYTANPVGADPTYNGQALDWYMLHCVQNLDQACPF